MFLFGPVTSFLHLFSWWFIWFYLACSTLRSLLHSLPVVLVHLVIGSNSILLAVVFPVAIVKEGNYLSVDNNNLFPSYISSWHASRRGRLDSNIAVTNSPIIRMIPFHLEDLKLLFLVKIKMLLLPVSLAPIQHLDCLCATTMFWVFDYVPKI